MITRRSSRRLEAGTAKVEQSVVKEGGEKGANNEKGEIVNNETPPTKKARGCLKKSLPTKPLPSTSQTTTPSSPVKPTPSPAKQKLSTTKKTSASKKAPATKELPATEKPPATTKIKRKTGKRKLEEVEVEPKDSDEQQLEEQPKTQPEKKPKLGPVSFDSDEEEPVIGHLKELSGDKADPNQHVNIETEIVDQIALEGLSGITLSKLFQLLEALCPNFKCTQDEKCANFILVLLKKYLRYPENSNIQSYYVDPTLSKNNEGATIPEGRNIIKDKPIPLPQQTMKRFGKSDSSIHPVQEELIMGSCKSYLYRLDITEEVWKLLNNDSSLKSLNGLNAKYGLSNIYFVACQNLRSRAIMPKWADPNIDVKLREYCVLELIGKSRTFGTVFPNDKALGRYRIMLIGKGFITQYQETSSSPIEHHLRRFYRKRLTPKKKKKSNKYKSKDSDSDSDDDECSKEKPLSKYCCDPGKLKVDRSILSMVYDVVAESNGLMQLEVRRKIKFPKFHLRNHLKNLVHIEMLYSKISQSDPDRAGFRVFRTAHKSGKRRKAKDEFVKPTGIMAKWDESDLRAKKIIGHKRSSFSKAEDSLLILCRITSILIEPNLKLSWCVHKRLVRDILHKELVESHDKTSDACLRRIKYLKRLPNNIMSINELTAELRDDPDIRRLIPGKLHSNDKKLNKLFVKVLKSVRTKIPNLLGITSTSSSSSSQITHRSRNSNQLIKSEFASTTLRDQSDEMDDSSSKDREKYYEIKDYNDLKEKYDLIDCQSLASISRAPTYEKPKNVVDVKFNNACLVTMAFYLTSCFQSKEERFRRSELHWLLEKFYSNYPDKLISSMLSKLNKRSLLTRKCSADQASSYSLAYNRKSLKLNQSVLFLLNRHQSHSLMQLASTISLIYKINLSENNEMASIALLTSLCSSGTFNLDMELKIPSNVVGIDQGNENFRSLLERANEGTREILSRFMSRCGGSLAVDSTKTTTQTTTSQTPKASTSSSSLTTFTTTTDDTTTHRATISQQEESHQSAKSSSNDDDHHHQDKVDDGDNRSSTPMVGLEKSDSQQTGSNNKMDDSRRALFLLRHELKAHALDKCGSLADCLIVQPCNIKFSSDQELECKMKPLEEFLNQAQPLDIIDACESQQQHQQQQQQSKWLVKSSKLSKLELSNNDNSNTNSNDDVDDNNKDNDAEEENDLDDVEKNLNARKVSVEYEARLWKTIEGNVHLSTLFKLIESLLSWIMVHPGVELATLQGEFNHLMPDEHLLELLDLMESLELIHGSKVKIPSKKPRLFGYKILDSCQLEPVITYEPSANAYVIYCQLLNYCK